MLKEPYPSAAVIEDAHQRIRPFIHRTPILTNLTINRLAGFDCYFKCENFQKIGAFKARGGINAVLSLSPEELRNGVATHSSGNHAQALAYAAREAGAKAYIVMPDNSPQVKINAVRDYGAQVTFCPNTPEDRQHTVDRIVAETGAAFIHPFNDYRVIAGQATAAKELLEDTTSELDAIIAPVGGGGLLSGTSLAAHYWSPSSIVYAGEPEGAADAILSFQSGTIEKAPFVKTIADGLLTPLGEKTLAIIRSHVQDICLVSENEIIDAMRLIWERMKIIIEPSSAVAFAAALKMKNQLRGKKVGIILTGGNIDLGKLNYFS